MDFVEVQKLPLTSIGKIDLAALKRIAILHDLNVHGGTEVAADWGIHGFSHWLPKAFSTRLVAIERLS